MTLLVIPTQTARTVSGTVPPTVPARNVAWLYAIRESGTVARLARSGGHTCARARARTYIYFSENKNKACRFSWIGRNNQHFLAARNAARPGTTVPPTVPLRGNR